MRRHTTDGRTIQGTGRWISIQCSPAITSRHSLWEYGDDNGDGTRSLWHFSHYGRRFALGQFYRYGSPWGLSNPPTWEEADGLHHVAGLEEGSWFNPLLIELSECGDAVRVWQEVE